MEWFAKHKLFDDTVTALRLLISRICATEQESINRHLAEEVTLSVQKDLDSKSYPDATIQRSSPIITLSKLHN